MALTLYLLRHGETESSRTGGYCGKLDIDLSPVGYQMAEDFGEAYKNHPFAGVYVSPLLRARATAEPFCRKAGLDMQLCEGLRELEYGEWEGKSAAEVSRDHHQDYLLWLADAGWNGPTGGERGMDLAQRAMNELMAIWRKHRDGDVLIVSHKATIRVLICQLLGLDIGRYRDRVHIPVASLAVVELREHGPLLCRLGDRAHLRPELRDLPGT
jgi:probable phosphoglycerate mutase